jgi:hypothetical protein
MQNIVSGLDPKHREALADFLRTEAGTAFRAAVTLHAAHGIFAGMESESCKLGGKIEAGNFSLMLQHTASGAKPQDGPTYDFDA